MYHVTAQSRGLAETDWWASTQGGRERTAMRPPLVLYQPGILSRQKIQKIHTLCTFAHLYLDRNRILLQLEL